MLAIVETIREAFPWVQSSPSLDEAQIREISNPMELPEHYSLIEVIPLFMQYCVKHPDDDLVVTWTIHALAEYGRAKDPDNDYLNFRFRCDETQRQAVCAFLGWAKGPPCDGDTEQINRAMKNWST